MPTDTTAETKTSAPETQWMSDGRLLFSAWDAASFLGVSHATMMYALYSAPDEARYRPFEIPKRTGGTRQIHAPVGQVRKMQEAFAPKLAAAYRAHPAAHGFIRERSILTNADLHTGQRLVLNVDLKDFFPSINFGRVRGLFMAPPFSLGPAAATVLAQLCTWQNGLPQGAPTSPHLSNLISMRLDRKLARLARQNGARYSRYADDITFSTNQTRFSPSIAEYVQAAEEGLQVRAGEALNRAIQANGFSVNEAKVRLQTRNMRQAVTGLTVNDRANVGRKRIRRVRAMLHAWKKYGLGAAAREHFLRYRGLARQPENAEKAYRNVVYGQLAFLKMVRGAEDAVFLNLCAKVLELDPNPSRFLRQMVFGADDFDVFISHASEDKEAIARPMFAACAKLGMKPFLDEAHIGWGQSFTQKINTALGSSRTVLAIISPASVAKEWPVLEVNTALSLEASGQKKVVPVIVGEPDLSRLPLVAAKDCMFWNGDADAVAKRLKAAVSGAAPRRPVEGAETVTTVPVTDERVRPQTTLTAARGPLDDPPRRKSSMWRKLLGRARD